MNMKKIDKNLVPDTITTIPNGKTYSVREAPFRLYGLYKPENKGVFKRMPAETAAKVGEGYSLMNCMTSGVRARFKTDASVMQLRVITPTVTPVTTSGTITAMKGFDVYIKDNAGKERYYKSFRPPVSFTDEYEAELSMPCGMKDITLYFPMYNQIEDVFISIPEDAVLLAGSSYPQNAPILFYGSSITQGCCVSRTGNTYPSILSRMLDTDIINLGVSGGAKGQLPVAEYIAGLTLRAFVYDYDHNAPDVDFLQATHELFFNTVRKAQPNLPILLLSKPDFQKGEDEARREVIRATYNHAMAAGDKNVYFIDGESFFKGEYEDICTADGCHPNDHGYLCMAIKIASVLQKIL